MHKVIVKLKKVLNLAVKVGFFSLVLISNVCLGQREISGLYQKGHSSGEGFVSYFFSSDGKVRFEKGLNLGQTLFSNGTYVLSKDDTLTLQFVKSKTSDSGDLVVERERLTVGVSSLSITVFDVSDSSRVALVPVLHLLDSSGNELTSLHTNAEGRINLDIKSNLITKLVFRFVGYHTLEFRTADFLGHSASWQVYLHPASEIELKSDTTKYHLTKTEGYIVLTGENGISSKFIRLRSDH